MTIKKRGLGKGLSALISEDFSSKEEEVSKDSILNINIKDIIPNKNQPRRDFDEDALKELAKSIELYGLIQPILVREVKGKYEIVAGERRWRACKLAGLKEIPGILKDMGQEESAKIALIENIQREDLNPVEEAHAYKKLMEEFNLTQEELSAQIGKSRSYISNSIRILNLDNEVLDHISSGDLSQGHGKAILSIKNKDEQIKIAKEILNKKLNVRDTESLTRSKSNIEKELEKDLDQSYIISIEDKLMMALGTKVNLLQGDKKGKIEIEYYGDEDLERLLEVLTK